MTAALRDGVLPGSFVPLSVLASLLVGAVLALLAARLLARRAPRLAAGAGLVLLLVAVLRALADAADVLSPGEPGLHVALLALLVLAGLAAGAAAGRAVSTPDGTADGTARADRRGRDAVVVAAVVLAHLALFAPYDVPGTVSFGEPPPVELAWLRVGLFGALAGGALAALRPAPRTASAGVVGVLLLAAAHPLLEHVPVHAVAAGLVLGVLLPVLVRLAQDAGSVPGLLLGVVLVLGAVTADDLLADAQEPQAAPELGLEVVSNDEYEALLDDVDRDPSVSVPSFSRIRPGPGRLPG